MKTQSLFTVLVLVAVAICTSATPALASGPAAGVSASPTTITNEGQEATFTLTLSSPAPRMFALNFVMTGSAIDGDDYILLGNFNESGGVVFSPGQSTATVTLHSFSNDRPGPQKDRDSQHSEWKWVPARISLPRASDDTGAALRLRLP
jgi:hypothetical protein